MATSSIEWTDRVWNPTVGCSKVSAGCKHCYAERQHARLTRMGQTKYAEPFTVVKPWAAQLADPLTWKKPARIFVNSMSDLFHEDVPDSYIAAVFGVIAAAPQHTFQVLTKRAERMARWFEWMKDLAKITTGPDGLPVDDLEVRRCILAMDQHVERAFHVEYQPWPLPNVWLGVSVENQEQADARIPHLLRTPAAVRFLSCEPLLGPVRLDHLDVERAGDREWCFIDALTGRHTDMGRPCRDVPHVDWVIVGGESGPGARPCALEWIEGVVGQCRSASVPVFVKQLGACVVSEERTYPIQDMAAVTGKTPFEFGKHRAPDCTVWAWRAGLRDKKGGDPAEWPEELRVRQFPAGGR